ncbi:MAG: response regulator transcription factor [Deferribacteres bacterium]|nr:response regulator transcription factor [Deferribacteres bacterium]
MKLLLIEDELELLQEMQHYLEKENYLCETAHTFREADEKIHMYPYDIAIVDITLPGGSGLELIEMLKKAHPETGIIIVSAKNSLHDKLSGLETGADDYLTKPFHLSELNARVKSLLRRRKFQGAKTVCFNELEVKLEDNSVLVHGSKLVLTKKEYELLLYFIANKNRLLTRESIAEHLWGDNIDFVNNFDFIYTHINNLRKKIRQTGGVDYIRTVYGMGYKFTDQ